MKNLEITRLPGMARKTYLRNRDTRFVARRRARAKAGVRCYVLPLNTEGLTAWLVSSGRPATP
jgi:hypothetical protein